MSIPRLRIPAVTMSLADDSRSMTLAGKSVRSRMQTMTSKSARAVATASLSPKCSLKTVSSNLERTPNQPRLPNDPGSRPRRQSIKSYYGLLTYAENLKMSEGTVSIRIESHPGGNVAHVTIEREKKLNALSHDQAIRFMEAFDALHDVEDLRAVVLSGAGERAFMGGADVQELRQLDAESGRAFIEAVHGVCDCVRSCPVPVIGRINGFCLGAGMELAAACDIRIVSKRAVFGMPEVQVGLPPSSRPRCCRCSSAGAKPDGWCSQ